MGQIADDMINGFQCSWCGTCFEQEHGYPVACEGCWQDALEEVESKGYETQKNECGVITMISGVQRAIERES